MRSAIALLLLVALCACDRQNAAPEQGNDAAPAVASAAPGNETIVRETIGTLDRSHKGEAALDVAFEGPDGKPLTLASFKGKPVLLNLWATWCAPCVAEMPTLDRLAVDSGDRLQVLTVSQDLDPAKVQPFMADKGYKRLKPYRDPRLGFSTGYQANLPTTFLFDAEGREVWRMVGGMDWTGQTARELVAEAG